MKVEERRQRLMEHIFREDHVEVERLREVFEVSRVTIHRDLESLEKQGFIRRVHGGATALPSTVLESGFQFRFNVQAAEKRAMARVAARHVQPGDVIFLDDSTTVLAMADALGADGPVTVVTNGLALIERLRAASEVNLIGLGGTYNARYNSFVGLMCERAIHSLRANRAFLSTSAVVGLTAFHQSEDVVRTKVAMLDAADRAYLIVDHTKFAKTALHVLDDLARFDEIVTTSELAGEQVAAMTDRRLPLKIVAVDDASAAPARAGVGPGARRQHGQRTPNPTAGENGRS